LLHRKEAFDAIAARRIWQSNTDSPVLSAPISYAVNGTQYLAVVADAGGATMLEGGTGMAAQQSTGTMARLLVYSLQGKAVLPIPTPTAPQAPIGIDSALEAKLAAKGARHYETHCARCHGRETLNAGPLKPLSPCLLTEERFPGRVAQSQKNLRRNSCITGRLVLLSARVAGYGRS
jgi:cytochrome c553